MIEPSDDELSQLPETSMNYILGLEAENKALREENVYLIRDALRDELGELTLEDFDNWIDQNLMGTVGQEPELKEGD